SIHPDVLAPAECETLLGELAGSPRTRAGARHLMSHAAVRALATDSRLTTIARAGLGRRPIPFRATLFEKSAEANWLISWHQDTALPMAAQCKSIEWGPWSWKGGIAYAHAPRWALERVIALRVHLDASGDANGPLRVIPGSHRHGVMRDDEVLGYVREHASVDCPSPRGGVLAMRPLLIHASSK